MSTVFLGTSEFAAAVLGRLACSEAHRPALVITRPDRPSGRGRRLTSPPVAERALSLGIPLEQPQSVNDPQPRALIARALGASADAEPASHAGEADAARTAGDAHTVIVCAFGALIKEPLLSEYQLLNVHPSLLPRWRGAAPIERAIMAGDTRTGVSIMRLTAGLDSGPVCLAGEEPIRPDDSYGSLAERLQALGGELLVRALDEAPPFVEQPRRGSHTPRRSPPPTACSTPRGLPSSSSASCALCSRTSAPASRSPTGRSSGCTARRCTTTTRRTGGRVPPAHEHTTRLARLCPRGCASTTAPAARLQPRRARAASRAAAGRARDGRLRLSARSRTAGAPVGAHVLRGRDARAQPRVRLRRPTPLVSGITPAHAGSA